MTEWQNIQSSSVADTEIYGCALARLLGGGSVLAVYGDLGAGKTVLARGIARGLGITEAVTSPTFAIVQEYRAPVGLWLYHLDLYRIGNEQDALAFGIEEYLFAGDSVTVIEWPERIQGLLGDTEAVEVPDGGGRLTGLIPVHIAADGGETRRLRVPAMVGARLLQRLEAVRD